MNEVHCADVRRAVGHAVQELQRHEERERRIAGQRQPPHNGCEPGNRDQPGCAEFRRDAPRKREKQNFRENADRPERSAPRSRQSLLLPDDRCRTT